MKIVGFELDIFDSRVIVSFSVYFFLFRCSLDFFMGFSFGFVKIYCYKVSFRELEIFGLFIGGFLEFRIVFGI